MIPKKCEKKGAKMSISPFICSNFFRTSQAEQGHTRVPSSPSSNWTQSIQQSSNIFYLFY